jgi:hypothetical protein
VPNILALDEAPSTVLWSTLEGVTVADVAALLTVREVTA